MRTWLGEGLKKNESVISPRKSHTTPFVGRVGVSYLVSDFSSSLILRQTSLGCGRVCLVEVLTPVVLLLAFIHGEFDLHLSFKAEGAVVLGGTGGNRHLVLGCVCDG